jgi:hypothetical protein
MANIIGNVLKKLLADKDFDWINDDIVVLLVNSTNDWDPDDSYVGDINTLGELSGDGYERKILGSKTVTRDDTNNRTELDAADVDYTAIDAGTAAAALVIRDNGVSDATNEVLVKIDTGGFPLVTNGGDATVQWNAEGIIQIA